MKYENRIRRLKEMMDMRYYNGPLIVEGCAMDGTFICRGADGTRLHLSESSILGRDSLMIFKNGDVFEQYNRARGNTQTKNNAVIIDDVQ